MNDTYTHVFIWKPWLWMKKKESQITTCEQTDTDTHTHRKFHCKYISDINFLFSGHIGHHILILIIIIFIHWQNEFPSYFRFSRLIIIIIVIINNHNQYRFFFYENWKSGWMIMSNSRIYISMSKDGQFIWEKKEKKIWPI